MGIQVAPRRRLAPVVVVIRMFVTPIPIVGLFLLAGFLEVMLFHVVVGLILDPGFIFVVVPIVIVLVGRVVNADLSANFLGLRSSRVR